MTTAVVVLLSAIPVAALGFLGARWGGRRLGTHLIALTCGATFGYWGIRWGWSRPFGLLTPLIAALVTCALVARLALRHSVAGAFVSATNRRVGAGLGAICGVTVAGTLWTAVALGEGIADAPRAPSAATESSAQGWIHSLVRAAHHGFVRHLPLVGPLGDEVEATIAILNAPLEARRHLAEARQWRRLARLDSFRALLADREVVADLDELGRGNVLALYRLQRNPRIIAFMQEEQVRALLPDLRPTTLARELEVD